MDKWTRKYMKLAKALADNNTACLSRKLAVVLVDQENSIISMGYNGSIRHAFHNDDPDYLRHLWDNLLTDEERARVRAKYVGTDNGPSFVAKFRDSGVCPRRILDIPPGQGLELCNCSHAERNAIFNAARKGTSTAGSTMYCWCPVPCHECAIAIIQSGIRHVVCLDLGLPDYSRSSRGLFSMGGVTLALVSEADIMAEGN